MATISELIGWASKQLSQSESARIDAEIILASILGQNRTYLYTWSDREISAESRSRFRRLIEKRAAGEPVAYLVGRQAFWSFDLKVSPATLIPRPETELLVELALERIPGDGSVKVADLGTGSGAIALAIASEHPQIQVIATDSSASALEIAGQNAESLGLNHVEFRLGSWFEPLQLCGAPEQFNLIISNPPY
ncbi:MAG: peptide chain release factor N(5)-glutamine methyltransferase, partial [Gammaproteobacteria bacterium]|nr:peptide chain release factor N(5)-glutamine methyltransferase [Gammaproteobacteria bacterium]